MTNGKSPIYRGASWGVLAVLSVTSINAYGAETDTTSFEEIVITAERRATSEQDMAVSIIALSGDTLKERGVDTFERLQYQVPSLTFVDNGNTKYLNIRGVGLSESAPNQTTGVAVHLDGGYIAREFVYGDAFFDLESVEVLRGPQGTYSGQNASGGAIFINSKKPRLGETSGFADIEYSSYDHFRIGAGVDIPLTETLAARIAGDFETKDSFYENHGPLDTTPAHQIENQPGNRNRFLGRFQLLFAPSEALEVRLIHQISDNRTDGTTNNFFPQLGSTELSEDSARELNYDEPGYINILYNRSTATAKWDVSDTVRMLANFSYQTTRQDLHADADLGSPHTNPTAAQEVIDFLIEDEYWTGELNLLSTGDDPSSMQINLHEVSHELLHSYNQLVVLR